MIGDFTALGLPLMGSEDHDIIHPMEIILVVKGLDSEDNVRYWVIKTEDLMNIEARGMLDFGLQILRTS